MVPIDNRCIKGAAFARNIEAAFGPTWIGAAVTLAAWAAGYELIRRRHNRRVAAWGLIAEHSA